MTTELTIKWTKEFEELYTAFEGKMILMETEDKTQWLVTMEDTNIAIYFKTAKDAINGLVGMIKTFEIRTYWKLTDMNQSK